MSSISDTFAINFRAPLKTIPGAARTLRFLCFSEPIPSISQQPNTTTTLSTKPKTSLLQKHTLFTKAHQKVSSQIKEKILCLEIMGVDAGKALSLNPALHAVSLHSIESIIVFLQSKGLRHNDLPRIFGMCPRILTSHIKSDLTPVFDFLQDDLKVPDSHFRKVINKCPRLLVSSVPDQLKPALFYLQRLGLRDLRALAYQDPDLLVSSVENTLVPKLKFLQSLGLSRYEVVGMVKRCNGLLTYSIERNFMPKYEYFSVEMEGKVEELREFPQYFAFSLEKRIKPRHLEMVQRGVRLPLPVMLKTTDDEFRNLLNQYLLCE